MTKSLTKLQKKSQKKQFGGAPPVMAGPRKKPPPPKRTPVVTDPAPVPGALQNATGARSRTSSNAGVPAQVPVTAETRNGCRIC
jgi:hypothetical protein